MSAHSGAPGEAHVAHQFDSAEQQRTSAEMGMWLFLITEVLFFGGLFMAYTLYRWSFPHAFAEASMHLNLIWGGVNTFVLLTSSLTMALAVNSAEIGNQKQLKAFLLWTILFGCIFLGVKVVEYSDKFHHHLIPGPHFQFEGGDAKHAQIFFFLYFAMTGLHAIHMIIGIGLLSYIYVMAKRGTYSPAYYNPVHVSGLYWHFVDIVWIFLYPLLYLIGAR